MDPKPRRQMLRCLALACALSLPLPAVGASFSNVSISLAAGNTLDFTDNTGTERSTNLSSASVLSASAGAFATRYAAVVGADMTGGGNDLTRNFTASFTISFEVTAGVGGLWDVVLDFGRAGALTVVSDGNGDATVTLGAMAGSVGGAGSLSAGSLGLAALPATTNSANQGQDRNDGFNQTGTATISGVGTGAAQLVSITFTFTASAVSNDRPGGGTNEGDEAALRMGLTSALGLFSADNYPGSDARDPNTDGVLVSATLVPEPDTALMIAIGLGGLAVLGRERRLDPAA
jgi:hypothetical protein